MTRKLVWAALLSFIICLFGSETNRALAQPCQWNYSMQPGSAAPGGPGTATANYCGNATVNGTMTVSGGINANINSVPSIAALQAVPAPIFGSTYNVIGFYSGSNLGGGIFNLFNSACNNAGAGDGGTQFPASTGGCWIRQVTNATVNVMQFGAKCDATTDDTSPVTKMENAAYANHWAVTYDAFGKYCKTTATIEAKPGVDHSCSGMTTANNATVPLPCGLINQNSAQIVFTVTSTLYGNNPNQSFMAPTFHDMEINAAGGCIKIGDKATGVNQPNAAYLKIDRLTCSSSATQKALEVNICFYCEVSNSWFITGVQFYMSDYVTVRNNSFNPAFTGDNGAALAFLSDSTFGNDDVAEHNFFQCRSGGTTGCLVSNAQSVRIINNGFECVNTGLYSVIRLTAPTSQGGFQNTIENNDISCPSTTTVNGWLSVENTQYLYMLSVKNNYCTCQIQTANFASAPGWPLYVPGTGIPTRIVHEGNRNEAGFPWTSYTNFPSPQAASSKSLFTAQPGASTYDVNGTSGYGGSVQVAQGAYLIPAAAGGNPLNFNNVPYNYTGTLDICILAASSTASQQVQLVSQDGGAGINTSTFTLTANPTWNCFTGHVYATGATATIQNVDTTHNGIVKLYQVNITQQ